jgi:hypothetical protein
VVILKALKERNFFKTLQACDIIYDCMDMETGTIEDFETLQEKIEELLD